MQPFKDLPPLPNPFAPRAEEEPEFQRWSKEADMLKSWAHLFPPIGPKCVPTPAPADSYKSLIASNDGMRNYISELERACDKKDEQIATLKLELALASSNVGCFPFPKSLPRPLGDCKGSGCYNNPLGPTETVFVSGVYEQLALKRAAKKDT